VRVFITVRDKSGSVFVGETDLRPKQGRTKSMTAQPTHAREVQMSAPTRTVGHPRTPTDGLRRLHQKNVFKVKREFKAVEEELGKIDCNFPKASLAKALERADFLTRHGKRGSYSWIQKYPPGE
jgi:hypothetical protein